MKKRRKILSLVCAFVVFTLLITVGAAYAQSLIGENITERFEWLYQDGQGGTIDDVSVIWPEGRIEALCQRSAEVRTLISAIQDEDLPNIALYNDGEHPQELAAAQASRDEHYAQLKAIILDNWDRSSNYFTSELEGCRQYIRNAGLDKLDKVIACAEAMYTSGTSYDGPVWTESTDYAYSYRFDYDSSDKTITFQVFDFQTVLSSTWSTGYAKTTYSVWADVASFSYDVEYEYTNGEVSGLKIKYYNLPEFLKGGNAAVNADDAIALTPVLKVMSNYGSDRSYDDANSMYHIVHSLQWDYVESLGIQKNNKNAYFTEFDISDYNLDNGYYEIAFVFTFTDADGRRYAYEMSYPVATSEYVNTNEWTRTGEKTAVIGGETETVFYKQLTQSSGYNTCEGLYPAGLITFYVNDPDTAGYKVEATAASYQYGHFDPSFFVMKARTDGGDFETDGLPLFNSTFATDVRLHKDVCYFRLYKKYSDGTRTAVIHDPAYSEQYENSCFTIYDVFNDLNVGNYELHVMCEGVTTGDNTYHGGFSNVVDFSVVPYNVEADGSDIYLSVGTGAESIYSYLDILCEETTDIKTYIAFATKYAQLDEDEIAEMESAIFEAYETVKEKYSAAYALYEKVRRTGDSYNYGYNIFSALVDNYYTLLSMETDTYDSNHSGYGSSITQLRRYFDYFYTNGYCSGYLDISASTAELAMENTPVKKLYNAYTEYKDAYQDYVDVCAGYGIQISYNSDNDTYYDDMLAYFTGLLQNVGDAWSINPLFIEDTFDIDTVTPIIPIEPEFPVAPVKSNEISIDYTGRGRVPSLILNQIKEHTIVTQVKSLFNQAALSSVSSYVDNGGSNAMCAYMVYVLDPESKLYGFSGAEIGRAQGTRSASDKVEYAPLAYRITSDGVDIMDCTDSGVYAIDLEFEGNYTGTISGLTMSIKPQNVVIPSEAQTRTSTYNGKAVDVSAFKYYEVHEADTVFYNFGGYRRLNKGFNENPSVIYATCSTSGYSLLTEEREGTLALRVNFNTVIEKYDSDNDIWVEADEVCTPGYYRVTYTLADTTNYVGVCAGEPVSSFVKYYTVHPGDLHFDCEKINAEYGETIGDVAARLPSLFATSNVDIAPADLYTYYSALSGITYVGASEPEFLSADTPIVAGEQYKAWLRVDIAENFEFSGEDAIEVVTVGNEECAYYVYNFAGEKKSVEAIWSEELEIVYDGESHGEEISAYFIGIDGEEHELEVIMLNDFTNAGTYEFSVKFADEDAGSYRIKNNAHSAFVYTILPKEITPAEGDIILEEGKDAVVYGDDVTEIGYEYIVDGLIGYDDGFEASTEETSIFNVKSVKFFIRTANGGLYDGPVYIDETLLSRIPAGTVYAELEIECTSDNYVLSTSKLVIPFEIEKKELTVTWSNTSYTFNNGVQLITASVAGYIDENNVVFANISSAAYPNAKLYISTGNSTFKNVGNYTATINLGDDGDNYVINTNETKAISIAPKNGSNATLIFEDETEYDGSEKRPSVTVKDGLITLTEGTDYEVSYSDNVDAGFATITVTFKGNYTDTAEGEFEILPKDLNIQPEDIEIVGSLVYTGSEIEPEFVIYDGTKALVKDVDYEVEFEENVIPGLAQGCIYFTGNYNGFAIKDFIITKKSVTADWSYSNSIYNGANQPVTAKYTDVNGDEVALVVVGTTPKNVGEYSLTAEFATTDEAECYTISNPAKTVNITEKAVQITTSDIEIASATYTGTALTPAVTVSDGEITFVENVDYTLTFSDNVNAGTATVVVTFKGNYSGTAQKTFTINRKSGSDATLIFEAETEYDGSEKKPSVTVKDGLITLTEGTDYEVSYSDNVNVGPATITVTFKGNYTDTAEGNFDIVWKILNIQSEDIEVVGSLVYTGSEIEPEFVIYDGTIALVKGVDYEVEFEENVIPGTAQAYFNFIGNYMGITAKQFTITKKSVTADWSYSSSVYNGANQPVTAKYTDVNGDEVALVVAGTTPKNVGEYSLTAEFATTDEDECYTISNPAKTVNITEKAVQISASDIEIASATYTGTALTPAVTVSDGEITFVENVDYTLTFSDNVNAGTAKVVVTFKGNYSGTAQKTFTINKKNLQNATVTLAGSVTYNGLNQKPAPVVKDGNKVLVEGTDYTLTYANNKNAGTASLTINFIGNYAGTASKTFTIAPIAITSAGADVTIATGSIYNGQEQTPAVTVRNNGKTLVSGTDYTVAYSNNVNAGSATVTVTFKGNYSGSATRQFTIAKKSVRADWSYDSKTYNASEQPVAASYTDAGNNTVALTVTGITPENVGSYTLTADFASEEEKNNYTLLDSTKTVVITAKALELSEDDISAQNAEYNGEEQKPGVVIYDGAELLVDGTDYVLSYENNVNAGTATVSISFMGNYSGTAEKHFTINRKSGVDAGDIIFEDVVYNGEAQKPMTLVYDGDKVLENGKDYTIAYSNNVNAGEATATITFIGNYEGTVAKSFTILQKDQTLTDKVTVSDAVYNGEAQQPKPVIVDGNYTLVENVDYVVSYLNNVNAGAAMLIIDFKGNYSGKVTKAFEIKRKADITADDVTISSVEYNGNAHKPAVVIVSGGKTLLENVDYTVAYSNNINAGKAKAEITFYGNYSGKIEKTFTIEPIKRVPSADEIEISGEFVYNGSEFKPELTVKLGSTKLVNGVDYDVTYSNNVHAGVATASIELKGNYSGSTSKSFTIAKATYDMSAIKIEKTYSIYDGSEVLLDLVKNLPDGVKVTYEPEKIKEVGKYDIVAHFTGSEDYNDIADMTISFEIRKGTKSNSEKTADKPTQTPDPSGNNTPEPTEEPVEEKETVIVESSVGFPSDVELRVVITTELKAETVEESKFIINYEEELEDGEVLAGVYDVKLISIINGVEKEIQPEDLGEGAVLTVKMAIPEGVDITGCRILHVHSADDITELVPGTEPDIGVYTVEGNFIVTKIDKLSEFAFIANKTAEIYHFILVALLVLYIVFAIIACKKKDAMKKSIKLVISLIFVAASIALGLIGYLTAGCIFCLIVMIVNIAVGVAGIVCGKKKDKKK